MSDDGFDLDRYFRRVNWGGGSTATYDTLSRVLNAHVNAIPFENFDVLLGRPPRLDLKSLQEKIVRGRRGGYCFEHATLLAAALEVMGFSVERCSARVVLFQPASKSPRAHMYLIVNLDGARYVVDPGFGMWGTKAPSPIGPSGRPAAEATHRMSITDGVLTAWVMRDGTEAPGWVSTATPEYAIDFEVANHFTATHPQSPFVNTIVATAAAVGGRTTVTNAEVAIVDAGTTERRSLASGKELRELVHNRFGFDLPEIETMRVPAVPDWR